MLGRKILQAIIALSLIVAVLGCKQKTDRAQQDHEPISEAEYQDILNMKIPDDGPFKHEKLIAENTIRYYSLAAKTGEELYAEIGEKGPSHICKGCSWAYDWNYNWTWDVKNLNGVCAVIWVNSKVWLNYDVPLWVREHEAPEPLRQRYSIWMKDVWRGINSKTSIILQGMAQMERKIMTLPAQDCSELDRRIKVEGTLAITQIGNDLDALVPSPDSQYGWMLKF